MEPLIVGRFASERLRGEFELPIHATLVGQRFDRIEVRLTVADYLDRRVQEWLTCGVFCRVRDARDFRVDVSVVP